MVSLFLLLGCNLRYIVDLFAGLHELASATARTLLKLASSVRALLKPNGDTLKPKNSHTLNQLFFIDGVENLNLYPNSNTCFVHDGEDEFGLCLTHTTQ